MMPKSTKKKIAVCKKNPNGLGHPFVDTRKKRPKNCSVSLYVSGLAIKKNISVE